MSEKPLFVCYSFNLMLFLRENGVRYEVEAVHKLTNAPLWVYVRNDKLKKLLGDWECTKSKNNICR